MQACKTTTATAAHPRNAVTPIRFVFAETVLFAGAARFARADAGAEQEVELGCSNAGFVSGSNRWVELDMVVAPISRIGKKQANGFCNDMDFAMTSNTCTYYTKSVVQ